MTQDAKQAMYASAWHGELPYDAKEIVRLEKAARIVAEHARGLNLGRRYDLLDVGCGVGPLRKWLNPEQFHITGLELSAEAAAIARSHYDACQVGDVESAWPVEEASADGVHAGAIMEHVVDWHAPLNHANRALREGGLLVVTTPNLRYYKEVWRLVRGRQPHWLVCMGHLHGYTPRFLRQLVTMHGFEVTALEADRVPGLLLRSTGRWLCRKFAGIGSVMILSARRTRRVRVEDESAAGRFPQSTPVALRSIEVPLESPAK